MRILLAEDEKELARAVQVILEKQDYLVDVVHDGQDAYDYANLAEYDGMIFDIMMPKISGVEVVKKLREEGSQVPILLLTAKSAVEDRIDGLDSGADDYLTKPFSMGELLARVRAMTRRKSIFVADILSFGDLKLDRETRTLSCKDKEVKLANKEFQIMELLIENPHRLFSADQLLEKIGGFESDVEMNSIWVHISNMRKKLALLQSSVRIVATRGAGYSLEEGND